MKKLTFVLMVGVSVVCMSADAIAGLVVTIGSDDYYITDHSVDIDNAVAAAVADGFGSDWVAKFPDSVIARSIVDAITAQEAPSEVFGHASPVGLHYLVTSWGDYLSDSTQEKIAYKRSQSGLDVWSGFPASHGSGFTDNSDQFHWAIKSTATVPEPSTFLCFCLVGLAFGAVRRRRREKNQEAPA